jgi:hypothetical protein
LQSPDAGDAPLARPKSTFTDGVLTMFTEQTRRHALAAALPPSHRDARALVEASVRNVLDAHPELRAVRWTQRLDDPDPTVLLASKVVVEFENGSTFELDTATADGPCDLDATAFAIVADLVLAQTGG